MAVTLRSTDGVALNLHGWPLAVPAAARLLVLHGRGEHGGRYAEVAGELRAARVECHALDARGFGASGPAARPRGAIRRFAEYLLDVDAAVDHVLAAGGAPLFALGQSVGGLVLVRWAQTRPARAARLAGLVLTAPFLALPAPPTGLERVLLPLVSAVRPDTRVPSAGTPNTRDEARWREALADPLRVAAPTARWVTTVLAEQPRALAAARDLGRPLLVLQGEADTATVPATSQRLAALAGGEYRAFPGCRHELLSELPAERAQVLQAIGDFLRAHAQAAA